MYAKRFSLLSLLLLAAFVLSACVTGLPDTGGPDLIHTQAVQTVIAAFTQTAVPTQGEAQPTATQYPTATLAPSATALPTFTPLPTATFIPPTATSVPAPCNRAEFIKDVTVADGTVFGYDDSFTKTWRIRNNGSCTWSTQYALVYRSGSQMDGENSYSLTAAVRPGETVDLSIRLNAPAEEGKFTGYWALKSDSGQIFGIGADGSQALWVSINVRDDVELSYDYTQNLCEHTWTTNLGSLACPLPDENILTGYYKIVAQPVLEGGYKDDEAALIMVPPVGNNTYITVKLDDFKVQEERFRAVLGCMDGAVNCNVKFVLEYQIRGEQPKVLGTWTETHDKKTTQIDIDLSFLEGKQVNLILTVMSNGGNGSQGNNNNNQNSPTADDIAFWLFPSLWQ